MAASEDVSLSKEILENITKIKQVSEDDLDQELTASINSLKSSGYNCDIILASGWRSVERINNNRKYIPRWQSPLGEGISKFMGSFDGIPIFNVSRSDEQEYLAIIDVSKIGNIVQSRANHQTVEIFYFSIKAITSEIFDQMVLSNPQILVNETTGQPKNRAEVLSDFLKRVHMKIFERVHFHATDKNAGILLRITADN